MLIKNCFYAVSFNDDELSLIDQALSLWEESLRSDCYNHDADIAAAGNAMMDLYMWRHDHQLLPIRTLAAIYNAVSFWMDAATDFPETVPAPTNATRAYAKAITISLRKVI